MQHHDECYRGALRRTTSLRARANALAHAPDEMTQHRKLARIREADTILRMAIIRNNRRGG